MEASPLQGEVQDLGRGTANLHLDAAEQPAPDGAEQVHLQCGCSQTSEYVRLVQRHSHVGLA